MMGCEDGSHSWFSRIGRSCQDWLQKPSKPESEEQKKKSEKHIKGNRKIDCKARMLFHQCVSATIF